MPTSNTNVPRAVPGVKKQYTQEGARVFTPQAGRTSGELPPDESRRINSAFLPGSGLDGAPTAWDGMLPFDAKLAEENIKANTLPVEDPAAAVEGQKNTVQNMDVHDTIATTEYSLKEVRKNGERRKERREDFVARSNSEGFGVFEGDAAAYGYRRVEEVRLGARQIQEELSRLSVEADIRMKADGNKVYNIGQIKKEEFPKIKGSDGPRGNSSDEGNVPAVQAALSGSSVEDGALREKTSSVDSISQTGENGNRNFSFAEDEGQSDVDVLSRAAVNRVQQSAFLPGSGLDGAPMLLQRTMVTRLFLHGRL